jgi:hypothetical protein
MRRLKLLKDLLSIPAVAVLILIAALGNFDIFTGLFPRLKTLVEGFGWISQTLAWLANGTFANWVLILVAVLAVAIFEGAYRSLGPYLWPKPRMAFSTSVDSRIVKDRTIMYASLEAHNLQEHEITECYATLESATSIYGTQIANVLAIRNSRLRWRDDKTATEDCKITLPPGASNTRWVAVADTLNGFQFSACKPSTSDRGLLGLYSIKIRVDGRLQGSNIESQLFKGYLYVGQVKGSSDLTMILGQGDWRDDKRLPSSVRRGSKRSS